MTDAETKPSDAGRGRLWFGGDYNPEQWPEAVWQDDLHLMRRARVSMATVGVFSWARLEPQDGQFDFGWFDRVIDGLHGAGVRVDLATATASPPPWLTTAHPEVLPVTEQGVTLSHGSRQAYCPSSPVYRRYAARLVDALVTRYGNHPAVELWHIGNEYGCHVSACYCDVSADAFRGWLKNRYDAIDALNDAWGTAFWSQRYTDFAEILPPRATPTTHNPTQLRDFQRFSSDELLNCFRSEAAIIRAGSTVPLTTNFMGFFKPLDYWAWAQEVDIISDDSYPDPADPSSVVSAAMTRDLARSLGHGRPWLLMEQATSAVNWRRRNARKLPGQNRALSYQAVAHGADGVLYFQWRQSAAGAEKFHSGMVPHAGADTRIFREAEQLGEELHQLSAVAGQLSQSDVAFVLDWDSWWALEQEAVPANVDYLGDMTTWYRAFYRRNVPVNFVPISANFSDYRLVVLSHLHVLDERTADRLDAFVRQGGVLVVSSLTGTLDPDLHVPAAGYLGKLQLTLGVTVEEFVPHTDAHGAANIVPIGGALGKLDGEGWAEVLHPAGAEVLATFNADPENGPAVTVYSRGDGKAWYVATQPTSPSADRITAAVLLDAGITPPFGRQPEGVEVMQRGSFRFVINQNSRAAFFSEGGERPATRLGPFEVLISEAGEGEPKGARR